MDAEKHKKHAALNRPDFGDFGRHEWAILGTPCGNIKELAFNLTKALSPIWNVAYVDADHTSSDGSDAVPALAAGAHLTYTDKIGFHRFDRSEKLGTFQYRTLFNNTDLVLVNGNHFSAKSQVVVIDSMKEDSLKRKLDRLTNVVLILLTEGVTEIPPFLKEHLAKTCHWSSISTFQFNDFKKIEAFFREKMEAAVPSLKGIVLAGGKSRRMRQDKSQLEYHGVPQRDYMLRQLTGVCTEVFLSCRPDQTATLLLDYPLLVDSFLHLGPMGALLSAFQKEPDTAWLAVACDLPMLDESTLRFLVENRDPSAIATAFRSPKDEFPEPLVAIWEPKSYPVLFQFLAQGYSCPRKVLINSPARLLEAPNPDALRNVNTPEEVKEVLKLLGKQV
ncbi:MAG: molybdopterin-guanine dinucleotide biosynthesis protein MobA [Saprospiraceae bacterium]|nr:MAG: molybdopterin-guanine dinucleotide biosynthesis protein MobA [Saprospiraceae bacterium]